MNRKLGYGLLSLLLFFGAAFLVWQNTPTKRFARHLVKARLYAQESNFTAAREEYEKAYATRGGFTPYADLEVLQFTNRQALSSRNLQEALSNTRKFLEAHPLSDAGALILADLALQSHQLDLALQTLNQILARNPAQFTARLMLTRIRTQQQRLDLAEEQLRYLIKHYPDSVSTMAPLAENLLQQGRAGESRDIAFAALKANSKSTSLRLLLVDSYLMQRNLDSAQIALDAWSLADPTMKLPIAMRKSRLVMLKGDIASAQALLKPYLERSEDNIPAYGDYAVLHVIQGAYDSALQVYATMAEIKPDLEGSLARLKVFIHLKQENPASALEQLKALSINNRDPQLTRLQLVTYVALGQDQKITEMLAAQPDSLKPGLAAFVTQFPSNKSFVGQWGLINYYQLSSMPWPAFQSIEALYKAWPQNRLAASLYANELTRMRRHSDALAVIEKLADTTLSHRIAVIQLAVQAGASEKAITLAKKELALHPKTVGLNLLIGDQLLSKGKNAESATYYENELTLSPGNPVVLNNLIWEYGIVRGDMPKAAPYLEQLRKQNPNDPRMLDTMGWLLYKNGQLAEAEKILAQALVLVPDHPSFNYHLAATLAKMGKADDARKHLEIALSYRGPWLEHTEAEGLLKSL